MQNNWKTSILINTKPKTAGDLPAIQGGKNALIRWRQVFPAGIGSSFQLNSETLVTDPAGALLVFSIEKRHCSLQAALAHGCGTAGAGSSRHRWFKSLDLNLVSGMSTLGSARKRLTRKRWETRFSQVYSPKEASPFLSLQGVSKTRNVNHEPRSQFVHWLHKAGFVSICFDSS